MTQIDDCGNATNVIPGRVEATLNFRYAPTRTPDGGRGAAARARRARARDHADLARGARRARARRSSQQLRAAGGFAVEPKQAWTNVADFAARGLDALNLGPGATRFAHTADEQVEIAELGRTYDALQTFLRGTLRWSSRRCSPSSSSTRSRGSTTGGPRRGAAGST